MHLTQLRDTVNAVLGERGDVLLSHVRVMQNADVLIVHNAPLGEEAIDHQADPPRTIAEAETAAAHARVRKDLLLAIAEGVSVEDRFAAADVDDLVALTYDELAQLLEYKDAALDPPIDPKTARGVHMVKPDLEGQATEVRMPCPQFDENKVACVLAFGHEGDHDFDPAHATQGGPVESTDLKQAEAELGKVTGEAMAKLPPE